MDVFRFYREFLGYRYYGEMLPYMLGPIGLLAVQLVLLPSALSRGGQARLLAFLVTAVLGLGLAVGLFHAGAFPYFWMTLGLFPAVALAIGLPFILHLKQRTRRRILAPFWAVFVATTVYAGVELSDDRQAVQRETLDFIRTNFPSNLEGFHNTRALFCRDLNDPLPTRFSQNIYNEFFGAGADEAAESLAAEFRSRPIAFLIFTFRLKQFPEPVRRFWIEHYVPYSGPVYVAGTAIDDAGPLQFEFDVLVPGAYTFYSNEIGARLKIGTTELGPRDTIRLVPGYHTIDRSQAGGGAIFALAIPAPPGPTNARFYTPF
jgi:hypothetical protein